MSARVEAWLRAACADARERGLPELEPLLQTLARSTAALRLADDRQRLPAPSETAANPPRT